MAFFMKHKSEYIFLNIELKSKVDYQ